MTIIQICGWSRYGSIIRECSIRTRILRYDVEKAYGHLRKSSSNHSILLVVVGVFLNNFWLSCLNVCCSSKAAFEAILESLANVDSTSFVLCTSRVRVDWKLPRRLHRLSFWLVGWHHCNVYWAFSHYWYCCRIILLIYHSKSKFSSIKTCASMKYHLTCPIWERENKWSQQ